MKRRDPRERAREGLGEALARVGREQAREEGRGPEPWPGDLYVLPETADFPVEWLLIERERQGRCRVVATDANPVLGCADVTLPPEAAAGPLSVRCAVDATVEVDSLRRGARTCTLAAEDLDRVRRRREELAAGAVTDPRLGSPEEPDPEYEDWLDEVLLPACRALSASREESVSERRWMLRGMAVAVVLSLLLALLGVSALAWRYEQGERQAENEIRRLEAEHRKAQVAELRKEKEIQNLLETHRQQLQELQAAEAKHLEELRARSVPPPPAAPRRPPLQPLTNLAYDSLYPTESRGTVKETVVPPQMTSLFLVLYAGQQPSFSEYRLEITDRASGIEVLHADQLWPSPRQEVSVVLPLAQLPDGTYLLRLYGMRGKERKDVAQYELRLRSGDEPAEP